MSQDEPPLEKWPRSATPTVPERPEASNGLGGAEVPADGPAPSATQLPLAPALLGLFTHTGDAVVVVDRELRVIMANGPARRMLGEDARGWLGNPCFHLFDCGVADGHSCWILDDVLAGKPVTRHTLPARRGGDCWSPVTISTLAVPLVDEGGPYLVHVFQAPETGQAPPAARAADGPRVYCLGEFRVVGASPRGADPVIWGRKKVRDVFKYLVTHRHRWVRREELLDTFWPNLSAAAAAHNLRVTLSSLRKVAEALTDSADEAIVLTRDTLIRLAGDDRVWVDASEFAHRARRALALPTPLTDAAVAELEAAVRLYTGDFLPEDVYEDWTGDERDRLLTLYLTAVQRLARAFIDRGWTERALQCLHDLARRNPVDEPAHRLLMTELVRAGRRLEALRHYQALVTFLHRELGEAPLPETVRLHQRILAGEAL